MSTITAKAPTGTIPQTDLRAAYLARRDAIDGAVVKVLAGGWYVLGKEVAGFEQAFAAYIGRKHGIGVASGTDAIELALRGCGIGAGDAVFTVSHTAVATVAGIERTGATPVLVDIEPLTYNLDPRWLEQAVTRCAGLRPRAVVAVHLYGQAADMAAIVEVARRHELYVVEDCAQAHGAQWRRRKCGSFGHAAAFSFYPTKNLGALGDGGMVVADDPALAERVRQLREYGWRERYVSAEPGMNSRLDELQAAVLSAKLRFLDADNARRVAIAARYDALIANPAVRKPTARPGCMHVYHQYVLRAAKRDALRAYLKERGVATLVHYPVPVHEQPAYRGRLPEVGGLEQSQRAAREVLSLPMYPQLTDGQVATVAEAVNSFAG